MKRKYEKWYDYIETIVGENLSIDVWIGDSINNPNNDAKSQYTLNSTKRFYRLTGETIWQEETNLIKALINQFL